MTAPATPATEAPAKVCGAPCGTYSCQRSPHGPGTEHKSLAGPTAGMPGFVSFLYWGGSHGQGERWTRKRVVW